MNSDKGVKAIQWRKGLFSVNDARKIDIFKKNNI